MNTYTALGLALAASVEDKTTLVLVRHDTDVRDAITAVARVTLGGDAVAPERVSHANGAAEIRYRDGGRILVRTTASFRNVSADTVFIDDGGMHELRTRGTAFSEQVHNDIRAVLATSRTPEVVYG